MDCRLLYNSEMQTDRTTHKHLHSSNLHHMATSPLAKLPLCYCYVKPMLLQSSWMLSPLARQPSDSLELDIIVVVRTPIDRITRTQTPRGDVAAYTR